MVAVMQVMAVLTLIVVDTAVHGDDSGDERNDSGNSYAAEKKLIKVVTVNVIGFAIGGCSGSGEGNGDGNSVCNWQYSCWRYYQC